MADGGYLNNTLLGVLSVRETDAKEAVVGQGGQVLCELGRLSKTYGGSDPTLLESTGGGQPWSVETGGRNSYRFSRNRSRSLGFTE